MKNPKIVLLTFLICGFTFISCQNNDIKINFQEKIIKDTIFQEIILKDIKNIKENNQFTLIKFRNLYHLEDSIYWFIGFRGNITWPTIAGIYNSNNNRLNIAIDNQKTDFSVDSTKFYTNINNNKHFIIITFNSNLVFVNEYLQDTLFKYYFNKPDHDWLIGNIIDEFKNSLTNPKIQKKSDAIKIEFYDKIDSIPVSELYFFKVK